MKKLTLSSIRKPLNLLLRFEISQSRFVEMLNDEVGFDREYDDYTNETNENIIYVKKNRLNIFILDEHGYSNGYNYYYHLYKDSDYIKIDLNKKEYNIFKKPNDIITKIISSGLLYNTIRKNIT